jgi:nucleoside 2-deoxyribosyltransferase
MANYFLICPVRGADPNATKAVVDLYEHKGHKVHWPPRDTDQIDSTGFRICKDNRKAVEAADKILVVWDGKSQGGLFDLGMAFALRKEIEIVSIPPLTEGKSFQNMVTKWETEGPV